MTANQNELIISSLFKVMIIFRKTRSLPFILRKSVFTETGNTTPSVLSQNFWLQHITFFKEGLTMTCYLFWSNHYGELSLVIPSFLLMKNMNGEKWLLNILNINQYLIVSWAVDFNLQIKYWFFCHLKREMEKFKICDTVWAQYRNISEQSLDIYP